VSEICVAQIIKVSNLAQSSIPFICTVAAMNKEIQMLTVELDGNDGLIVTFSDGTIGAYVIEELLILRPIRERVATKKTQIDVQAKVLR
jgi:hypothetical protein